MDSVNDPAMTARAFEAACTVAAEHGLASTAAVVIADANNVLVHLRPAPVVARVATTAATFSDPSERLARELAVAGFLAERGAAVVAPSGELPAGPHHSGGLWMSFWRHVECAEPASAEPEEAARALAPLHALLAESPLELPVLEPVLGELPRVIEALAVTRIDAVDLDLLQAA
ncbi:MAG TPA: hypothetical protein VMU66_09385, partial [Gaiellales bacterium]|nr:hypothetical protein [Gaiellales bacterium]